MSNSSQINEIEKIDNKILNESENEKNKETDKKTKISANERGRKIVRIAAFCFALVSWVATSEGLKNYVFRGNAWQAYLISFGIQAILFVMNLKLPDYFGKIGKKIKSIHLKRFCKCFVAFFYAVFIFASSWFSYVFIANQVYENTQYIDSNIVLNSTYREFINKAETYINEDTKAMQLVVNIKVAELQEEIAVNVTDEDKGPSNNLEIAQQEHSSALEILASRQDFYDAAKEAYETVANDPNVTQYTKRLRLEAYQSATESLNEAKTQVNIAYENLKKAEEFEKNNTIEGSVKNILTEILKSNPNIDVLQSSANDLNNFMLQYGNDADIENFSKLANKTQELNLAIGKYITLRQLVDNPNDENAITITSLKNAMLTDEVIVPMPIETDKSGNSDIKLEEEIKAEEIKFNKEVEEWKTYWTDKFQDLEMIVKAIPSFSETEANTLGENSVVNIEILKEFKANVIADDIDEVVRQNLSKVNELERAKDLLFGEYPFLAGFSLCLALFLDLASLFAGIFIYLTKKEIGPIKGKDSTQELV